MLAVLYTRPAAAVGHTRPLAWQLHSSPDVTAMLITVAQQCLFPPGQSVPVIEHHGNIHGKIKRNVQFASSSIYAACHSVATAAATAAASTGSSISQWFLGSGMPRLRPAFTIMARCQRCGAQPRKRRRCRGCGRLIGPGCAAGCCRIDGGPEAGWCWCVDCPPPRQPPPAEPEPEPPSTSTSPSRERSRSRS